MQVRPAAIEQDSTSGGAAPQAPRGRASAPGRGDRPHPGSGPCAALACRDFAPPRERRAPDRLRLDGGPVDGHAC